MFVFDNKKWMRMAIIEACFKFNSFGKTRIVAFGIALVLLSKLNVFAFAQNQSEASGFAVVDAGRACVILVDPDEAEVVREIAAESLAEDIARVAKIKPRVVQTDLFLSDHKTPQIIVGTVGQSDLIQHLVDEEYLNVSDLMGQWEAFKTVVLPKGLGVEQETLVIVGSDRRGTAYGVFEMSRLIGVSPWYWWADVPVKQKESIYIQPSAERVGPPKVKYRGIFINDEDWGLQPWAAKTYEPEVGDMGPKTYAAIFELLLRLKANYIWPAMHPSTKAFNYYKENKFVADRYAIVMGSSHAEPMLRNNVDEWKRDGQGEWNYVTNRDVILKYWDQRVAENGQFENIYTIGMRGVHDSRMVGGGTIEDQARRLEDIFSNQRAMLEKHVGKSADEIPQIFVPYKEVLPIYRSGLNVPDDVTLGWVDDNFGYIRQLSNAEERKRLGGSGVYYHMSYWGNPHDYLWIDSTSPGLIWSEMTKAYEFGADRVWVGNIGDIKPNELSMDWFLRLAWDPDQYSSVDVQQGFIDFFNENFGEEHGEDLASLMLAYYRLNHQRKPEHMRWSKIRSNTPTGNTELSHWMYGDEAQNRLDAFFQIEHDAMNIREQMPQAYWDAFDQLVMYPIQAAADMSRKVIYAEKSRLLAQVGLPAANKYAALSEHAFKRIQENTRIYNQEMADGKWNHVLSYRPRGLEVFTMPPVGSVDSEVDSSLRIFAEGKRVPAIAHGVADDSSGEKKKPQRIVLDLVDARISGQMKRVHDKGRLFVTFPQGQEDRILEPQENSKVVIDFDVPASGEYTLKFEVNHPEGTADSWHVAFNDAEPLTWNNNQTGGNWRWFELMFVNLSEGRHRLTIYPREDGAQLRQVELWPVEQSDASAHPNLVENPNDLPTLNRDLNQKVFVDLYTTGQEPVQWQASSDMPWVQFSEQKGEVQLHQRIWIHADFDLIKQAGQSDATIQIVSGDQIVHLNLSAFNPSVDIPDGAFVQANGIISIYAENYAQKDAGDAGAEWHLIDSVGYSGDCVGLLPRLLPDGVELVAGESAPALHYPIYVTDPESLNTPTTLKLYALPSHPITSDHRLVCSVSINGQAPQEVEFAQGNHQYSGVWQTNVLRNAMIGEIELNPLSLGLHHLTIYGTDPSVVLDRMVIEFGSVAPSYIGPMQTRVSNE